MVGEPGDGDWSGPWSLGDRGSPHGYCRDMAKQCHGWTGTRESRLVPGAQMDSAANCWAVGCQPVLVLNAPPSPAVSLLSWSHCSPTPRRGCRAVCDHRGHAERLVLAGRPGASPREQPSGRGPAPGYDPGWRRGGVGGAEQGLGACHQTTETAPPCLMWAGAGGPRPALCPPSACAVSVEARTSAERWNRLGEDVLAPFGAALCHFTSSPRL